MEMVGRTIPEAIMIEILARLSLRNIARFKSVSKTWKSVIISAYFRRLFVSMHKTSSSSWSLMFRTNYVDITEAISFHGCKTWDLPKSLGTYVHVFPFKQYPYLTPSDYEYIASSNGLILISVHDKRTYHYKYFVGNPVLQQWVEIPRPPDYNFIATGLVTRVDENGVVSSFKVVRTIYTNRNKNLWRMYVYSSETGLWTHKCLVSSYHVQNTAFYPCNINHAFYPCNINHNGMLYLFQRDPRYVGPGVLLAYDLYGFEDDDHCRVIPLPHESNAYLTPCLTTSGGDVFYIETISRKLTVWRLNNNAKSGEWWQVSREINMAFLGFDVRCCVPLAMNPYDSDIVYLWSKQHGGCLISGNLLKGEFIVHIESEKFVDSEGCCVINTHDSKRHIEAHGRAPVIVLSQFVLPRWMDPVPHPPCRLSN